MKGTIVQNSIFILNLRPVVLTKVLSVSAPGTLFIVKDEPTKEYLKLILDETGFARKKKFRVSTLLEVLQISLELNQRDQAMFIATVINYLN